MNRRFENIRGTVERQIDLGQLFLLIQIEKILLDR